MAADEPKPTSLSDTGVPTTVDSWKGKTLGRFKLLSELGKGAMGKVFRAEDINLRRQVALKVLPRKMLAGQKTYGLEQFFREARSAAKLEHPNVVQIYEISESGGVYYIAMELVEGGNLHGLVQAAGPLDYIKACQLCAEAAEALHYGHQNGVIHRDVKPANLMLTRNGRCKLTDFGLARLEDPEDTFKLPTEALGTPQYIAPEVAQGKPATAQADIYSLGATLWYLLTRVPPYRNESTQELLKMHVSSPIPNLRPLRPDVPESLVRAIEKALAKKPEDRFTSAEQFARVLRAHTIPVGVPNPNQGSSMGMIPPPGYPGGPPVLPGSSGQYALNNGPSGTIPVAGGDAMSGSHASFGIAGDASANDLTTIITHPVAAAPGQPVTGTMQIAYAANGSGQLVPLPAGHPAHGLEPWKFWAILGAGLGAIFLLMVIILVMLLTRPAAAPAPAPQTVTPPPPPATAPIAVVTPTTQPVVSAPPTPQPVAQPSTVQTVPLPTSPATPPAVVVVAPPVTPSTQPAAQPAPEPVLVAVAPVPTPTVTPTPAPTVTPTPTTAPAAVTPTVTPTPAPVVVVKPPEPPKVEPPKPPAVPAAPTSKWARLTPKATFDATATKPITDKASKGDGDVVAIKGKLARVDTIANGGQVIMKFDGAGAGGSFHCVYMPAQFEAMQKRFGGTNGEALQGKTITVKGTLQFTREGPRIRIEDPDQVTIEK
jgi:hypothetical protein